MIEMRDACRASEGDLHGVGHLGGQAVKGQRRQQAKHGAGHLLCDGQQVGFTGR